MFSRAVFVTRQYKQLCAHFTVITCFICFDKKLTKAGLFLSVDARYKEHPSADKCHGPESGLFYFWHGLVCVLPYRGTSYAGPPHHEHPGNPVDPLVGGVWHRVVRGALWQWNHQPSLAGALVPQADWTLRDSAGGRCGRPVCAAVCGDANLRGRHNAVLWADLPQAEILYQVWRSGHVRPFLGLYGRHCSICHPEEQKLAQTPERPPRAFSS